MTFKSIMTYECALGLCLGFFDEFRAFTLRYYCLFYDSKRDERRVEGKFCVFIVQRSPTRHHCHRHRFSILRSAVPLPIGFALLLLVCLLFVIRGPWLVVGHSTRQNTQFVSAADGLGTRYAITSLFTSILVVKLVIFRVISQ